MSKALLSLKLGLGQFTITVTATSQRGYMYVQIRYEVKNKPQFPEEHGKSGDTSS